MKTYITKDEQKLEVEFSYYPGTAQSWDYPGDPPELEITAVWDEDGKELELTEELEEWLSNELYENLDQHLPYEEDY